ncbi:MAG TPA: hypothetical protein VGK53_14910 [Propionicimonas sp.]
MVDDGVLDSVAATPQRAAPRRRPHRTSGPIPVRPVVATAGGGDRAGSALVLPLLVKTFLVQAFWIPSASMRDTLTENDGILVN